MNTTLEKGGRMSKSKKYKIKQKDFRKLEKLAERIYNTLLLLIIFAGLNKRLKSCIILLQSSKI